MFALVSVCMLISSIIVLMIFMDSYIVPFYRTRYFKSSQCQVVEISFTSQQRVFSWTAERMVFAVGSASTVDDAASPVNYSLAEDVHSNPITSLSELRVLMENRKVSSTCLRIYVRDGTRSERRLLLSDPQTFVRFNESRAQKVSLHDARSAFSCSVLNILSLSLGFSVSVCFVLVVRRLSSCHFKKSNRSRAQ